MWKTLYPWLRSGLWLRWSNLSKRLCPQKCELSFVGRNFESSPRVLCWKLYDNKECSKCSRLSIKMSEWDKRLWEWRKYVQFDVSFEKGELCIKSAYNKSTPRKMREKDGERFCFRKRLIQSISLWSTLNEIKISIKLFWRLAWHIKIEFNFREHNAWNFQQEFKPV